MLKCLAENVYELPETKLGTTRTVSMIRILAVSFALLLQACAAPVRVQPAPLSSGISTSANSDLCTYLSDHLAADGARLEAGYYCTPFLRAGISASSAATASASSVVSSLGCTFVPTYTKQDGSVVGPFVRCKSSQDAAAYKAVSASSEPAPCVTSYCGPVSVKGYYRKDGTYVRPHTRKK